MNTMVVLFIALVILAIFHFVYQTILAPSFKFEARLKLFRLRDRLRRLKIDNSDLLNDRLFCEIQEGINRQIHYFDRFTLVNIFQAYRSARGDEELDRQVWQFFELLDKCPIEDVGQVYEESINVFWESVAINSGGWISVILPFYVIDKLADLAGYIFSQIAKYKENVKKRFASQATRILETPDWVFNRQFERGF